MAVDLGQGYVSILPDTSNFATGLVGQVTAPLAGVSAAASSTASAAGIAAGGALSGGLMAAVTTAAPIAAIIAIGGAGMKSASILKEAYNIIRVATGATGDDLDALKADFQAVFTSIPTDAATAGTAIGELNTRLGLTGVPLQELSKQFIELTRITGGDLATNIAAGTRLFGDWSIATESQAGTLDYLFRVSQSTGIGFDRLNQLMVQFGAPLRGMGFDFETAAAMIGKFEKEGVNTEMVLSSLKIGLGRMAKEGITDAGQAFQELQKRVKGAATDSEGVALAMEYFGAKAGPDMALAIRENRLELGDFVSALQTSDETIMAAAKDTLGWKSSLQLMKNTMTTILAPIGQAIGGVLKPAVAGVAKAFEALAPTLINFIKNIDPAFVVGALVVIAGTIWSIVAPALGALAAGIWTSITPLLPFIAATLAVSAAVAFLVDKLGGWGVVMEKVKGFIDQAKMAWGFFVDGIKGEGDPEALTGPMRAIWDAGDKVGTIFGQVSRFVVRLWNNLQPLRDTFAATAANLKDQFAPILERFKQLWVDLQPTLQLVGDLLKVVGIVIGAVVAVAIGLVMGLLNGLMNAIGGVVQAFQGIAAVVLNVINLIIGLVTGDGAKISAAWEGIKQGVVDTFAGLWNAIKGLLEGFVQGVVDFFTGLYDTLVGHSIVPDTINSIVDWFLGLPGRVLGILSTFITNAIASFTTLSLNVIGAVETMVTTILARLQESPIFGPLIDAAQNVWEKMQEMKDKAVKAVKDLLAAIGGPIAAIVEKLKDLSPFTRHSPSLVEQVLKGTGIIQRSYEGLSGMSVEPPGTTSFLGLARARTAVAPAPAPASEQWDVTLQVNADEISDIASLIERLKGSRVQLRMAGGAA